MTGIEQSRARPPARGTGPLSVDHVAGALCCYCGETVTFYTRVDVDPDLPDFTLRVVLPAGVTLADYGGPTTQALPRVTLHEGANHLIWQVDRDGGPRGLEDAPTCYEYQVIATLPAGMPEVSLESRAVVTARGKDGSPLQVSETVAVAVSAQGRYLDHLPALYREDELMGRFLMLFESFWGPISRQIDNLALYFDPWLTPPEFLPWLASWIDLVLDEHWPLEKRRRLLANAVLLYRQRGTRQGMEQHLEIYAGARPKIVEHRAHNLRLGPGARLGPGIALGRGNEPHTFTVILHLPALAPPEDEARRRQIEAIIESQKPAHTGYQLRIETEVEP